MHRLMIICALSLTACADAAPRLVTLAPYVPADLRQPVTAPCPAGHTQGTLAVCLIRRTAGLAEANRRLGTINSILTQGETNAR